MPSLNNQKIVSVTRDKETKGITHFHLEDGSTVDYKQAISLISSGKASNLIVQDNQFGPMIRSKPEQNGSVRNLEDLPDNK